jgi:1,4-alpha-glucan branching enzyme
VGPRPGIEEYVAEAGFNYFFTDAHLARAGRSYSIYGAPGAAPPNVPGPNSPYQAYRVLQRRSGQTVATLVRDPVASRQVWSRQEGYPGDEWYLEFHKIRWPGGLKYWRVSAPGSDLGSKAPYDPQRAIGQAEQHAAHFAHLLETISGSTGRAVDPARPARPPTLIAVPFDTELFGHWWFEGIHFLASVYRHLVDNPRVHPSTASEHLAIHPPRRGIQLSPGSWGNNGDFSMWLNEGTRWTWPRLWAIEAAFWDRAPEALGDPARREILAQAARAMLLAQASDWQFIMTTGQVTDYAVRRFSGHCEEAEFLLGALAPGGDLSAAATRAQALWQRDHCFPDILTTVKEVLSAEGEIS